MLHWSAGSGAGQDTAEQEDKQQRPLLSLGLRPLQQPHRDTGIATLEGFSRQEGLEVSSRKIVSRTGTQISP